MMNSLEFMTDADLDQMIERLENASLIKRLTRNHAKELNAAHRERQRRMEAEKRTMEAEKRTMEVEIRTMEVEIRKRDSTINELQEEMSALGLTEKDDSMDVNDFKRGPIVNRLLSHFYSLDIDKEPDHIRRAMNLCLFDVIHFDAILDKMDLMGISCPFYRLPLNAPVEIPYMNMFWDGFYPSNLQKTLQKWTQSNPAAEHLTQESWMWSTVFALLLDFTPAISSLPEDQYRTSLWTPLLNCFISSWIRDIAFGTVEFKMSSISAYGKDARTDIVLQLRRTITFEKAFETKEGGTKRTGEKKTITEAIPFFLVECCAPKLRLANVHKDYSKLTTEMLAALLSILGYCRNLDTKEREKICVFGALTSGPQIRFCVLAPVFQANESVSFVFQAPDEWFVDLSKDPVGTNTTKYLSDAELERDSTEAAHLTSVSVLPTEAPKRSNIIGIKISQSNRFEEWPKEKTIENLNPLEADFEIILSGLKKIRNFGKIVVSKALELDTLLAQLEKEGRLSIPFSVSEVMKAHLPGSRSSSMDESPAKRVPMAPYPNSKTTQSPLTREMLGFSGSNRLPLESIEEVRERTSIGICTDYSTGQPGSVIVAKKPGRDELKFLLQMQSCQNVVRLLDWKDVNEGCLVLHLEYLTADFSFGETLFEVCESVFWGCWDGVNALQHLKTNGIVHRDISCGNFLFSPRERKWKLLDFGLAVSAKSSGVFKSKCLVGTKEYLAPEIQDTLCYTFGTDAYAMGQVLKKWLVEPGDATSCFFSEDWTWHVLGSARKVVGGLSRSKVTDRLTVDEAQRVINAQLQYLAMGLAREE